MDGKRFFLDTAFVLAILNRKDPLHSLAKTLLLQVRSAQEVWLHDGIIIEIGNALAYTNRAAAVNFIQRSYRTANAHVVSLNRDLLDRAVELYRTRPDKEWGLTDCLSFVVMQDYNLLDALTTDHHFQQAGFRALLLEQH